MAIEFSATHGVRQLPVFDAGHASNVPGLYVIGDLADAALLKTSLRQGADVGRALAVALGGRPAGGGVVDVLVVGGGPAGVACALTAREAGLEVLVVERDRPFATLRAFPRHKVLYAEPRGLSAPILPFEDGPAEAVVAAWDRVLAERSLPVAAPEEVVDVRRDGDSFVVATVAPSGERRVRRARRVVLAVGRRAALRRLGCPGEELPHVRHALDDAERLRGRRVVVVGGGDSAVEAALAIADAGGAPVLSYRGASFHRCRPRNRERVEAAIAAGRVTAALDTTVVEIRPDVVVLAGGGALREVPADEVIVSIGAELPRALLDRIGVRIQGAMHAGRAAWIAGFAAATYLFYVLKQKRAFWPFGPDDALGAVPELLKVHLPLGKGFADRVVDGGFWGTVAYTLAIAGFAALAVRRHPTPVQRRRYASLVAFQVVALFGVPELLAPLVIDRPWKVYAATVPWPLSIWSLVDAPSWAGGSTASAVGWLAVGALVSFVAIPLYVRRHGEAFCSWLCGCGGLAETVGDTWRHLAPRGRTAVSAEWGGRLVLAAAIPVTLLLLNDAWGLVATGALASTKAFAERWYGLVVDFGLASVLGVAAYPYLGNRVWCRFFCPLRAYMELWAKAWARVAITSDDRCIACGECTRQCQMGIDVMAFAQQQAPLHNGNSACIQCGICVEVCPMDVLSLGATRTAAPALR